VVVDHILVDHILVDHILEAHEVDHRLEEVVDVVGHSQVVAGRSQAEGSQVVDSLEALALQWQRHHYWRWVELRSSLRAEQVGLHAL